MNHGGRNKRANEEERESKQSLFACLFLLCLRFAFLFQTFLFEIWFQK
jgi:hypothetical protein